MTDQSPRTRLRAVRRMCVLAAAVASVAGCVGMPSNGPAQEFSASPASSAQDGNLIGSVPLGPQPGENPSQVVQGFLTAADSYPLYTVAKEYLTSRAVSSWTPGFAVTVYSKMNGPTQAPTPKPSPTRSPQATVEVSGTVQAKFNGSGQYVSAQNPVPASTSYEFTLVKVDGQWRIDDPPNYRMLLTGDFPYFYKAQDLYFMDPQDQVLVPDSVFVPLGATVSQLLTDLVDSLSANPKTPWLANATDTELPSGVTVQQVLDEDGTATVNLAVPKTVKPAPRQLELFAAQLVWTLIGPPASPFGGISSVVLELNGAPWAPADAPCPGGRLPGQAQTPGAYQCFNPYPSSPSSFYYVDRGQSWARCGAQYLGLSASIGSVVPIVGRTGAFTSQPCVPGQSVKEQDTALPPVQPASLPAVTAATVSPDGTYLAIVTADKGALYIGKLSGQAALFSSTPRLTGGDITSLSWDRNDDLWVTQDGVIYMLPAASKAADPVTFDQNQNQNVTDLAVAPDGVRLAFIAQAPGTTSTPSLYLAAIGGGPPGSGQLGSSAAHLAIKAAAAIGPGLSHPASIAWYDADDLIVVNDAASGNTLMEVPVDGQEPQEEIAPTGLTSITADGPANVLVAGLSGGYLDVSTSLIGPWVPLGEPGQNPAYPS
jgi:Lipoprotein LpqB beta-propeller domain/Sporulation and spore germination